MNKEGNSAFFFESKWIVGVWGFLMTEGVVVILWGLTLGCPYGKIQIILQGAALVGPILYFVGKLKSLGHAVMDVGENGIAFNGQKFKWDEISRICLEVTRKSLVPRLKIEWGKIPYFVELRYITDSERRAMLDEIEKHKPVQYMGCSYEKNYTAWNMTLLSVVLVAVQVGIACAVIMTILQ